MVAKVKKMYSDAKIPKYGTEKAACADVYAYFSYGEDIEIKPHETVKIGTGIMIEPPEGYCCLLFARSGMATKNDLAPANKVGILDEDYRGEYIVPLHNHGDKPQVVHKGDRIAQIMFIPYLQAQLIESDELSNTKRGNGGFGSTGTN